jgi:hypothetical protein
LFINTLKEKCKVYQNGNWHLQTYYNTVFKRSTQI